MSIFQDVSIEAVKSYWNARPCNLRHSTAPVGSEQYFNEVEARKYFVEPHIPQFAEFNRWKGKRVLEIGCGIGTDTMNFARAGADVTAVDLSIESLNLAKKRAQVLGLEERIRFFQANAQELSSVVPAEPYDLIYSFGVIHHTPNPEAVIDQINKHYAKEGTIFKIMVYYKYSFKVAKILITEGKGAFWELDKWVAKNSEAQTGCPVTYSYSKKGLKNLLRGFDVQDMQVDHIFSYRIPDYVKYKYVKEWYFRWMPEPWFRALEKQIGWHLCATARWQGSR